MNLGLATKHLDATFAIVVSGGGMAFFEYEFKKTSTGRRNKRTRYARGEEGLRRALLHDPEVAEIVSVRMLQPPSASDAQIGYLADLIGSVPSGLSMLEASDLISNAKERRSPGNDKDRQLAERFGVPFTRFSSKKAIFERITRGDLAPAQLAIWFVFRVYRDAFDRSLGNGIEDPDEPSLLAVAREVAANPAYASSLKRAALGSRTGFRWFGDLVMEDGELLNGDDETTEVYNFTASKLEGLALIDRQQRARRSSKLPSRQSAVHSSISGSNKRGARWIYWLIGLFVVFLLFRLM